jgi:alpha-D-ribose 1-methylphosphonate 5-phosphate C-P lyase
MANLSGYNFAYLDEQTKRMIRRAILKAVAIPGYQVLIQTRGIGPGLEYQRFQH